MDSPSSSPGGSRLSLSIEEDLISKDSKEGSATPASPSTASITTASPPPISPALASPTRPLSGQGDILSTSPPDQSQSPSSKCVHSSSEGRNLALCVDGTANQFGVNNTNVVELYARLIKSAEQLTYYNSGIGTYAKPSFKSWSYIKQVVDHSIDMAIAWRFESIIHAAYEWLSENYQPGDRIFLFGFSRGAYQVRVVAGMIEKVGLLHKGNKSQIPFAYELYTSTTDGAKRDGPRSGNGGDAGSSKSKTSGSLGAGPPGGGTSIRRTKNERTGDQRPIGNEGARNPDVPQGAPASHTHTGESSKAKTPDQICSQFKRALCHKDVKVHFVGAWDTVSSIGIARGRSLPETTSGMEHVCAFRHALALDEARVKFQPEYANGGRGPSPSSKGDVKEVWFAGSHSDIGGGIIENGDLNNFGPALRWMTYEAMSRGLKMEPYEGKWRTFTPNKSLTRMWLPLEILPLPHPSYQDNNSSTYAPHLGAPRVVLPGQLIHASVFQLMTPKEYSHPITDGVPSTPHKPMSRLSAFHKSIWGTSSTPSAPNQRPLDVLGKPNSSEPSPVRDGTLLIQSNSPGADPLPTETRMEKSMPGDYYVCKVPEDTAHRAFKYYPFAHLKLEGFKSWGDLRKVSDSEESLYERPVPTVIEGDPFVSASHALHLLNDACEELRQQAGEAGPHGNHNYNKFNACINTLRSFLDDDLRKRSITEVQDAADTLLIALEVDYQRGHPSSLSFEPVDILVQLLLCFPNGLPHCKRRYRRTQLRKWLSHANDQSATNKILQNFSIWFLQSQDVGYDAWFTRFFKEDQSILICAYWGYMVWDLPSGELTLRYTFPDQTHNGRVVNARTASTDGSLIAYGCIDPYAVTITDIQTGKVTQHKDLDDSKIRSVCFSHNSALLASGSHKGPVTVWKICTDRMEPRQLFGHIGDINALDFTADDSLLASACDDETVRIWNVKEGREVTVLRGLDSVALSISWNSSGNRIASGGVGQVIIWDLQGNITFNQNAHSGEQIWAIAFSPDGHQLVTGGHDRTLRAWDPEAQKQLWCLDSGSEVMSVAFSADGLHLVTGDDNGGVKIWDMDNA